jgi:2-methylcitrate dehydratase PrpD
LEVTKALSNFVYKIQYEDLPEEYIKRTKLAILDTLGCIILGSRNSSAEACIRLVKKIRGSEEASIFGTGLKTNSMYASLVNGTMGHRFDYDDGISGAPHVGITIIPAALALAEAEKVNGKTLITAINAGYELTIRVTKAMEEGGRLSLHSNCFGALGAAAASSKILGFNSMQTHNSIGICGAIIPAFPFEPFIGGAMVKDFYGGWPAFVGIFSALLAQHGLTGLNNIFEAKRGFYQVFAKQGYDKSVILSELGNKFTWMNEHYFKPYSACRGTHVAIDAALKLFNDGIATEMIEETIVIGRPETFEMRGGPTPINDIQARVSIQYTVAAALILGHVDVDAFDESNLKNPKITNLAKKVRTYVDPSIPSKPHRHGPIRIIIKMKDGKMTSSIAEEDRSLSDEKTIEKYERLSSCVLPQDKVEKSIETVKNLEKVTNILTLAELLKP